MRHPLLALTAVTLLAACSKPAPAAGAPSPAVTTTDSTAVPDSAAKTSTDSMTPPKDSLMPDSTTGK